MGETLAGLLADETAILGMLAAACFFGVIGLWQVMLEPARAQARRRRLERVREELSSRLLLQRRPALRDRGLGAMRDIVRGLKLMQGKETQKIREQLARAGLRSRDALIGFLFAKLMLPLGMAVAAVIGLYGINLFGLPPTGKLLAALAAVTLAAYAPDVFLKNLEARRREILIKGLPDGLDLLVICAEAGLSLDSALERVGRELGHAWPDLADELGVTAAELSFLPERRKALENLATRTGVPALRALCNTLIQAERYGTPLARALRVISAESRNARMMKAEEKAARLPAVLTVPMIIFILPALFVVLIGPGGLRVIDGLRGVTG